MRRCVRCCEALWACCCPAPASHDDAHQRHLQAAAVYTTEKEKLQFVELVEAHKAAWEAFNRPKILPILRAPAEPRCECGGSACNTTHSVWCKLFVA